VNTNASWSFGTSHRPALNNVKNVPGAGTYDITSRAVEGPAFYIGEKIENQSSIGQSLAKVAKNPGPNAY
jgi:hypothetical protein